MTENQWVWNARRETAALLVAQDELTDAQIAKEVGVSRKTLAEWKLRSEFRARVDQLVADIREGLRRRGIVEKQNRVDALNDRWQRLQQLIEERAEDPLLAHVPGGKTGLIVAKPILAKVYQEVVGEKGEEGDEVLVSLKKTVIVYEYAVDAAVLKEMRATEEQAAKELGQWSEKHEIAGTPAQSAVVEVYIPDNGRNTTTPDDSAGYPIDDSEDPNADGD